jgi:DNA polymerase I - 3''-5'' exonuclease and polymerase domains
MNHISLDFETYSSVDIKKCGAYKYTRSPDFDILLCAYSIDGEPVEILDLTNPIERGLFNTRFRQFVMNDDTILHAYNASFEFNCIRQYFNLPPDEADALLWRCRCTMLHGLYAGYTSGLAETGEAMGLPQDKRKMSEGKALIKLFCTPCTPTARNGGRTRNLPQHEPEKWELFKTYCKQDVVTEMEIERRLSPFPVPDNEQTLWVLDQQINGQGVMIDRELVDSALAVSEESTEALTAEAQQISGIDNPKSVKQLVEWLQEETDEEIEDLTKATVKELLDRGMSSDAAQRMLELRQELGKTSVKKYDAMINAVCDDGRVRGLLQFYGANRSGRWAGRLVQIQNLPQNHIEILSLARDCVKKRKSGAIKYIFGNIPDTLSQLIRTAFVPSPGNTFLVADFSAIEARVVAWLAGEQWVMDVFASHGKIYEATASQMFGVPIELIKKGNPEYALRQKGKIATLALGYGGSVGALVNMGALKQGLAEEELPDIVSRWRGANKRIVDLWYRMENAALDVVHTGYPVGVRGLILAREGDYATGQDFLTITLPSGRKLYYAHPRLLPNRFNRDSLHYDSVGQKNHKWGDTETFGGKIVENVVQAIARDCLAVSMQRLDAAGYKTVFHVHDEVIVDAPQSASVDDVCAIMGQPIPWAPGLLLKAAGFETFYYMKD